MWGHAHLRYLASSGVRKGKWRRRRPKAYTRSTWRWASNLKINIEKRLCVEWWGSIKSRSFLEVGPAFESLCAPLFARHMMLMTIMIPFCCLSKTGTPVLLYHSPISFYLYSDGCKRKTGTLRRPWEMSRGAGSPVIPILAYARGLCSVEHPKNVFSLNTVNNRSNKRNNEVWICLETGAHVES